MLFKNRPDGSPVKVPSFLKLLAVLMPTRTESTIYMNQKADIGKTLDFINQWNKNIPEGQSKLTLIQVFFTALGRTIAMRPWMNRFVSNCRHYQRNNIAVSFVAKKTLSDNGKEVNIVFPLEPYDTIADLNKRFMRYLESARSELGNKNDGDIDIFEKFPVPLLRFIMAILKFLDRHNMINSSLIKLLPFYSTAYFSHVGSLNIDPPYHHNFELGNIGIFISLGKKTTERSLDKNHQIVEKSVAGITYTFDERIVDGIYASRSIYLLKKLFENPQQLMEKPHFREETIKDLRITEKGKKLWLL